MVYKNASVKVYAQVNGKNTEGTITKTWGYKLNPPVDPSESFRCDVQPHTLTRAEQEAWGLSNRLSDAKKIFFTRSTYIQLANRVFVKSDFPGEPGCYYEIKGTNHWPNHGKAIALPIQGESEWVLSSIGSTHSWDDNFIWDDTGAWHD
jgi:hypothetical protein